LSDHKIPSDCYWTAHQQDGQVYDLSHLHPFDLTVTQSASGDKPARAYEFIVLFSIHCFTRDKYDNEIVPEEYFYSDNRHTRVFCSIRHELSFKLPDIVKNAEKKKVLNTGKGNFLIIDIIDENGNITEYEMYFSVSRSGKQKGKLNFYVESAYPRTTGEREKHLTPIRLHILAFKTLNNQPIKTNAHKKSHR